MFVDVDVGLKKFFKYQPLLDDELYEQIKVLAKQLKDSRVLHINSTYSRGGVAEILKSAVPLLKDLGIKSHWLSIDEMPQEVYTITKKVHNGLQGSSENLTAKQWELLESYNRQLARVFDASNWDFIFVHDHQLVPILSLMQDRSRAKWIWRSHTDSSQPNRSIMQIIIEYLRHYDAAIYTSKEFVLDVSNDQTLLISAPAIDPFSPKNLSLSEGDAQKIVKSFGVDPERPLITQVSRLDPWKDLPGAIEAWKLAAQKIAGLQLAIIGNYSTMDMQASGILKKIQSEANKSEDIFLIINTASPRDTKAFQVCSDVSLQKSIREGFGLTVTEALWSKTPVIGGNVGGIKLQIIDGKDGYLVNHSTDCADKIIEIVNNPDHQRRMGLYGFEHVRRNFLMPRLIRDEIELMVKLQN